MKKLLLILLTVVLLTSVAFVGCDKSGNDNASKAESFIVGLDDAFPPMGFRDENNEIVGFDIDLAKEAAKRLNMEVTFQPVDWSGVILELDNKKIDVIWNGMTITDERLQKINFTKPYIQDRQIIVVQKGSDIKGKVDLKDMVIGIQSGSSSMQAFEKDSETFNSVKEIVEFASNDEALLDLKNGGVDAVVVDEVVGRYYIAKKADDYKVLDENFGLEDFGVGVRKTDTEFLEKLNKVLDEMKEDGTAANISKKWFGEDIIKY